ncbi:MAG: hypothetical protein FWC77_00715 [Defluviitaleaceae bacterium]|nr:hypothetical protein [Defluviitaleaceae bacterium]
MIKILMLSAIILLILSFAACGSTITYEPESLTPESDIYAETYHQPALQVEAPQTHYEYQSATPEPTPAPLAAHTPATLTAIINDTPHIFHAYEISGELFIAIGDLSHALEHTRVQFSFWENPHDDRNSNIISGITTHIINERLHASLPELAVPVGFDVLSLYENEITICTNEPYISEIYFDAIVDFLITTYPQLFTREAVSEAAFGEHAGFWRAGSLRLSDFNGGRPVVAVGFHDAGSWGPVHYLFVNGQYQRIRYIPPAWELYKCPDGRLIWLDRVGYSYLISFDGEHTPVDIEESLLVPNRTLVSLNKQVTDEANRRLWPALAPRDDGIMVDGNLPDDVVDLVESFIMGLDTVQSIDVIKASQIQDNLVSVIVSRGYRFPGYHWVVLHEVEGKLEVHSHYEDFNWWGTN